ncbi:NAD+ synthase [Candidatus Bipolaricaulota bacterium]|nr:NAD+ synthase [Candidatus Bipolaricaulota bacterium]
MKVAIAQLDPTVGDFPGNVGKAEGILEEARRKGVKLVVFPELYLLGYPPRDLLLRPDFLREAEKAFARFRRVSRGISVVVGHILLGEEVEANRADPSAQAFGTGRALYNTAFLLDDGEIVGYQAKGRLPSFDVFEEERYFTPAREVRLLDWRGLRLGISVCEDFWYREGVIAEQIGAGADLLVNVSASPYFRGKPTIRWGLGRDWVRRGRVPLIYANLVGGQDEIIFDGNSFVLRPDGAFLLRAPAFVEGLFVCDLAGEPVKEPAEAGIEDIHAALVLGIRDYFRKNGLKGAVIGISGGIDSAVVSSLAVEALGRERVRLVFLPGPYTSELSQEGASAVARALGITLDVVPIGGIVSELAELLSHHIDTVGVVAENIQARVRGLILMAFANATGYAVLCPGNKAEIAMGYNTLYGDTVGALAPIGDLLKEEVYELARYINRRAGKEIIPAFVQERPPSAELRPDQTDEQDIPPYRILDPLLRELLVHNVPLGKLEADFGAEVVREVLRRLRRSEYKRKQLPPVLKVSPKAFGIGRRYPLTNLFEG